MRNDSSNHEALPGNRPPEWSFLAAEAKRLGFVAIGVAPAQPIDDAHIRRFESWVTAGYHSTMSYLEQNRPQRKDPGHNKMQPGATVVVSAALPYKDGRETRGLWTFAASHARGRDYHQTMAEKLGSLADAIQARFRAATYRIFVDSAPMMERTWAVQAGLGSIGLHGGLIVPDVGARVVLGEIVLTGPTCEDYSAKAAKSLSTCTECDLCVQACPTNALLGDGTLDSSRCLSFHTAENRAGELPPDIIPKLSTLFGCDICTAICPLENPDTAGQLDPLDSELGEFNQLSDLLTLSQNRLARALKNTTLARTGPAVIKRNARYLIANKGE